MSTLTPRHTHFYWHCKRLVSNQHRSNVLPRTIAWSSSLQDLQRVSLLLLLHLVSILILRGVKWEAANCTSWASVLRGNILTNLLTVQLSCSFNQNDSWQSGTKVRLTEALEFPKRFQRILRLDGYLAKKEEPTSYKVGVGRLGYFLVFCSCCSCGKGFLPTVFFISAFLHFLHVTCSWHLSLMKPRLPAGRWLMILQWLFSWPPCDLC